MNFWLLSLTQLLNESRFRDVDKIKTIGSTYMAAVGLKPERSSTIQDNDESTGTHLGTLAEFAFAMKSKLQNINENSYNNFMLRVGEETLIYTEYPSFS